jgi:hypothetical protein
MQHDQQLDWRTAAGLADFAFFEPDVQVRWAGGFAADGSHIEIVGSIDGREVSVDTTARVLPHDVRRRTALADLLWYHLVGDSSVLHLPCTITVEEDDRTVVIDDARHTARGMRVAGLRRWVGFVDLDGVVVRIMTDSDEDLSLRTCIDPKSLADRAPNTT